MEQLLTALAIALSTAGTLPVPEGENAIVWTQLECMNTRLLGNQYTPQGDFAEGFSSFAEWYEPYLDLSAAAFGGKSAASAFGYPVIAETEITVKAKLAREKVLGEHTFDVIDARLMACGNSFRAMAEVLARQ
jgi:hypothetical protein